MKSDILWESDEREVDLEMAREYTLNSFFAFHTHFKDHPDLQRLIKAWASFNKQDAYKKIKNPLYEHYKKEAKREALKELRANTDTVQSKK